MVSGKKIYIFYTRHQIDGKSSSWLLVKWTTKKPYQNIIILLIKLDNDLQRLQYLGQLSKAHVWNMPLQASFPKSTQFSSLSTHPSGPDGVVEGEWSQSNNIQKKTKNKYNICKQLNSDILTKWVCNYIPAKLWESNIIGSNKASHNVWWTLSTFFKNKYIVVLSVLDSFARVQFDRFREIPHAFCSIGSTEHHLAWSKEKQSPCYVLGYVNKHSLRPFSYSKN